MCISDREEALWKSADKLRGSVEPAEYKHVVLSLFFLTFASDKFEAQRKAISEKYGEKFVENVAFYTQDNVLDVYKRQQYAWAVAQHRLQLGRTQCFFQNKLRCDFPSSVVAYPVKIFIILSNSSVCNTF